MARSISLEDLRELLHGDERVQLVEALGPDYFADAHLPGAVNIRPCDAAELAPVLLPDRTATTVVYGSTSCRNSEALARRLDELGYEHVAVFRAGKEGWVERGLPVARSHRPS